MRFSTELLASSHLSQSDFHILAREDLISEFEEGFNLGLLQEPPPEKNMDSPRNSYPAKNLKIIFGQSRII